MRTETKWALAALLVFGSASAALADTNDRAGHHSSVAWRAIPVTDGRTGPVKHALKPFTADEKAWFAAPQLTLVENTLFGRDDIASGTMAWIKLTEPAGEPIYINLEHVISVRSDTQIPGAKAQLDLTSGKFQGVQESVDQVMRLIAAAAGARENAERA
jgi:hypothetical protein